MLYGAADNCPSCALQTRETTLGGLLSLGLFSCAIVLRNVGLCYFSARSGRGVFRIRNKVSLFSNIRIWHWKRRRVGCVFK